MAAGEYGDASFEIENQGREVLIIALPPQVLSTARHVQAQLAQTHPHAFRHDDRWS